MRVLSLFDGMSCGQIALRELGIIPETYYASEIDKHAIKQTQLNFPDTVQLGDVENWHSWPVDWSKIDLLLAGSPCQGFSFAGKQLAFDDPRSRLFFVFVDILNHCRKHNPDVRFLLENVNMKKEYLRAITEYTGVFPVRINSSLVSAQNRDRWYWSNVRVRQEGLFGELHTDVPTPADRGILLRDVLEETVADKYFLSEKAFKYITDPVRITKKHTAIDGEKSLPLMAKNINNWNGTAISAKNDDEDTTSDTPPGQGKVIQVCNIVSTGNFKNPQRGRIYSTEGISPTLNTCQGGGLELKIVVNDRIGGVTLTQRGIRFHRGDERKTGLSELGTIIYDDQKTDTHTTQHVQKIIENSRIRRLTPIECSRLQTIPDWYRWGCSDSQIYRMLGNGWTVEVIKHILSFMPGIEKLINISA